MKIIKILFDGGCHGNGTFGHGYGSYEITHDGNRFTHRMDFGNGETNNTAEFKTLIDGISDRVRDGKVAIITQAKLADLYVR